MKMVKSKEPKELYADDSDGKVGGSNAAALLGIVAILAGIVLLGANLLNVQMDTIPWPLYIIIPGVVLLFLGAQVGPGEPTERATWMARIGASLIVIGSLTAFVEVVDHYESWAYGWTLIPVASIAARMFVNRYNPDHPIHQSGPRTIRILLIAFVGLALFFELMIFSGNGRWWPLLLVAAGVYLLLTPRR
jgi:hypothetical protein